MQEDAGETRVGGLAKSWAPITLLNKDT
jgi:hypothetical protein